MRVEAPAGGMLAVVVVVVRRNMRLKWCWFVWVGINVKNDYGRRMGVPLLDISCLRSAQLARLHSSVSSNDRHLVWAEATSAHVELCC